MAAKSGIKNEILDELEKAPAERMLNAKIDRHLGQESEQAAGNHRNGGSAKTVLTDTGQIRAVDPAGSAAALRAGADRQILAAFPGLRRENHRTPRSRHDHARHSGAPARVLRGGDFARTRLSGNRRRAR